MPLSLHRYLAYLEFDVEFMVRFSFENVNVRTLRKRDLSKHWTRSDESGSFKEGQYLLVEIWTQIEDFDSLNEGGANVRPMLLASLGMLNFITNEPITIYDFSSVQNFVIKEIPKSYPRFLFIIDDEDKAEKLSKLINCLNGMITKEKTLVYSLFDRYRKAKYITKDDEEGMRFSDETFLAYFHIIELLSIEFESVFITNLKNNIKSFLDSLYSDVYLFDVGRTNTEVTSNKKLVEKLFIENIPLSAKACYMYSELKMFNEKTRYIVETYVKFRNDIAHGQSVYKAKLQFPLPPFFSQVEDINDEIEVISLLARRTIDAYIGTDFYKDEWDTFIRSYPEPFHKIKQFLSREEYTFISPLVFKQGRKNGVAPWMLTYYYVIKKGKLDKYEEAMKAVIMTLKENKRDTLNYLEACILLSDCSDEQLRKRSRELVSFAYKMRYPEVRARNYLKHFEYHQFKLIWFKKFVGTYLKTIN